MRKYVGWRNWAVLTYNSAMENVFVIFYIGLRSQLSSLFFVLDFFAFFLFSVLSTTYGYLVNDLADRKLDLLHGKDNTFQGDTPFKAAAIVLLFLTLSILFGLNFANRRFFLILWLCWIFLATFYSLKPIRLKERGKLGLILVVIAQRVLPTLIMFAAFRYYDWIDIAVFTTYIFLRGLSSDMNHQLEDYEKDISTGTDTYAARAGLSGAQTTFRFSLEIEKMLLAPCLLVMYFKLSSPSLYGFSLILPLLVFYLFLYGLTLFQVIWKRQKDVNPFVPRRKDIFQFIHHTFPSVLMPLYLLVLLVYQTWLFLPLFLFFAVYRRLYSVNLITNSLLVQLIRKMAQPKKMLS